MEKKYYFDNIEFNSDIVMDSFREIFDYIGSHVLAYDDTNLEGEIYEDYDFCYMHLADFRLNILLDSGEITKEIKSKAEEIRQLSEKMFGENIERSASFIRNSLDWKKIFSLADQVKDFLKNN